MNISSSRRAKQGWRWLSIKGIDEGLIEMSKEIEELKKEIDRLQNIALEQFEEKRIPNDKNHKRLMKLKKQLERLQKEGEL